MKILAWILQIILAIAFLGAGAMKVITPYEALIADTNMAWANDFSATAVLIIGILEVLGASGLIIPMFVKSLRRLLPLAALGLALTMAGASITHIWRDEPFYVPAILGVLCLILLRLRRDMLKG